MLRRIPRPVCTALVIASAAAPLTARRPIIRSVADVRIPRHSPSLTVSVAASPVGLDDVGVAIDAIRKPGNVIYVAPGQSPPSQSVRFWRQVAKDCVHRELVTNGKVLVALSTGD